MGLSSDGHSYAVCDTPGCLARCTPLGARSTGNVRTVTVNLSGSITVIPVEDTPGEAFVALPPAGWLVESLYRSVPGIVLGERTGEAWRCPAHVG